MKKGILSLLAVFLFTQINSQNLTIEETVTYINEELASIGATDVYGNKIDNHTYKLTLEDDGYLTLAYIHTVKNNIESQQIIHINDIESIGVDKFSGSVVRIKCNETNCCRNEDFIEDKITSRNDLMLKVPYNRSGERIKNALIHLVSEAKKTYSTKDPFAPENSDHKMKATNN
ncbi:MAG: hypothetical protein AB8B52_06445 [Winogradskyella sp.]|uniref:hypothetical protein n=1 Tax=Winogradskyella sp. TaxID=1883156 RepID=UPI00385E28DF